MDPEEGVSAPSTPATPGTPGAPLFGGLIKHERKNGGYGKKSLLKSCKCFSVEPWSSEEGTLPAVSCMLPPPPVSLARKVQTETLIQDLNYITDILSKILSSVEPVDYIVLHMPFIGECNVQLI